MRSTARSIFATAAECREVVRVAIVREELAPAPQGALRLAVPAPIPPAELDHRLLGKELLLRPLQQRVALLQAGVEPPGELARLAVRADQRFVLLQHPGKRRGQPLPGLPLVVPDAVEQRVVARCMEGVESLPRSGIRHAPPSPAATSPKHRGSEAHGGARRRCPRSPRPWEVPVSPWARPIIPSSRIAAAARTVRRASRSHSSEPGSGLLARRAKSSRHSRIRLHSSALSR